MPTPVVAVVGGGVAGLAAAWELLQGNDVRVVVLEAADAVGGKLRRAEVAGYSVDVGAESMLARRPEATGLVADLGLGSRLTHPEPVPAAVWSRGRRWPLPGGTVMGVPTDPAAAAGVLTPEEVVRASAEQVGPPVVEDVVGGHLRRRPRRARRSSTASSNRSSPASTPVTPGRSRCRRRCPRCGPPRPTARRSWVVPRPTRPVDRSSRATAEGSVLLASDLAAAVVDRGGQIRTRSTVRELARRPDGWRLTVGPTIDRESPRRRRRRARPAGDPGRPAAAPLLVPSRRSDSTRSTTPPWPS